MVPAVIVLSLIWIALTRSYAPVHVAIGVVVSAFVIFLQRRLFSQTEPIMPVLLRRPHRLLLFVGTLVARLVVSTLHTSWLILAGNEDGRFVVVPLRTRHPFAQFLLLNSITLTPSTISLLIEEDGLYIHWLQSKRGTADWRGIKESIERRILALFGERGDA